MPDLVWLITGTNSGLGLALAEYVLSQGHHVIATTRNLSKLPESLQRAKHLELDTSASQSEIQAVGVKALDLYGHVDVLVNMAGYGLESPVEEIDAKDLERQYATNVFGPVYLTQALLPSFRARKSGTILNISSIGSVDPGPGLAGYTSSKAALDAISETLAQEVAPWNIRVLIVQPSFFPTNWFAAATANPEQSKNSRPNATRTGAYAGVYGISAQIPLRNLRDHRIGDCRKAAQRMFEVVTRTGVAEGLGDEWDRILLGVECGERFEKFVRHLEGNLKATEAIWSSTEIEEAEMAALRAAAGLVD
ncbi:hypothetical protein EWM64_g1330 [Hericium alpestre]|uniref:Ketoreductase domain-containing protein n=1 Tax=Hericium alpestre TaxID=135208 RepID=A0A4Z0A6M6_9AGAM|nr:hypothetical protein EWM64_g1330 [Hericium alpestre]